MRVHDREINKAARVTSKGQPHLRQYRRTTSAEREAMRQQPIEFNVWHVLMVAALIISVGAIWWWGYKVGYADAEIMTVQCPSGMQLVCKESP